MRTAKIMRREPAHPAPVINNRDAGPEVDVAVPLRRIGSHLQSSKVYEENGVDATRQSAPLKCDHGMPRRIPELPRTHTGGRVSGLVRAWPGVTSRRMFADTCA
ncbi:hypothetical protein GCM10027419_27080 [Pandoraea terrae]